MPKRYREVKEIIDLTNDDELIKQAPSHAFFSVPQTQNMETAAESQSVEDAYMEMIKQFVDAANDNLTTNILSNIIIAIANDKSLQKQYFLSLRISLFETASALGTDDIAEKALNELRSTHKNDLFNSDRYRAPPNLRKKAMSKEMYQYIDYHLTVSVLDKLKSFETYDKFLEDFFSDFIAEIHVTSREHVKSILAKSAYLIGMGFLDNTIKTTKMDTTAIANIFLNFAIENKNPQAIRWIENQKPQQSKP